VGHNSHLQINKIRTIDVDIVDEVLALTKDIAKNYKTSKTNAKRAYLNFFFNKILVEDKQIVEVQYQPVIEVLNKAKLGILDKILLPLKDLFCNHKLEFDITLNNLKILYESLDIRQPSFL